MMARITSTVTLVVLFLTVSAAAQPDPIANLHSAAAEAAFVNCSDLSEATPFEKDNEFILLHHNYAIIVKREQFGRKLPIITGTKKSYLNSGFAFSAIVSMGKYLYGFKDLLTCRFYGGQNVNGGCRNMTDASYWIPGLKTSSSRSTERLYAAANISSQAIFIVRTYRKDGASTSTPPEPVMVVINSENLQTIKKVKYPNGSNGDNAPTALAFLGPVDGKLGIYVFFGHLYALYMVPEELSQPIEVDRSVLFRSAKTWYGCSPELCFEADFDAAIHVKGRYQMIRGKYIFEFKNFDKNAEPGESRKITDSYNVDQDVEAGFAFGSHIYLFAGQDVYVHNYDNSAINKYAVDKVFTGHQGTVTSAFMWDSIAYLIQGDSVTAYLQKSHTLFEKIREPIDIAQHWTQLPHNVESSTNIVDEGSGKNLAVMFTKGSFYYLGDEPKVGARSAATVHLSQGNLFKCTDEPYNRLKGNLIGVNGYSQFVEYVQHFTPKVMDPGPDPTPVPTEPPTTHATPTTTEKTEQTTTKSPLTTPQTSTDTATDTATDTTTKKSTETTAIATPDPTAESSSTIVTTTPVTPSSTINVLPTSSSGAQKGDTQRPASASLVVPIVISAIGFLALAAAMVFFLISRRKSGATRRHLSEVRSETHDLDKYAFSVSTVKTIDSNSITSKKKGIRNDKASPAPNLAPKVLKVAKPLYTRPTKAKKPKA